MKPRWSARRPPLVRGIATLLATWLMFLPALQVEADSLTGEQPTYIEPGVLDVQAWDWLQQDFDRLIDRTRAGIRMRLSADVFEAKYVDATIKFLEIDAAATTDFNSAVNKAISELAQARIGMLEQRAKLDSKTTEIDAMLESRARTQANNNAQRHAVRHLLAVLEARPRHQLLREEILKWLLRLDYGIGTASR